MPTVDLGVVPVVINRCWGGFGLSRAVHDWLKAMDSELVSGPDDGLYAICGKECWEPDFERFPGARAHPDLVAAVRALGAAANGLSAELVIEEVHLTIEIDDYDGMERIVRG